MHVALMVDADWMLDQTSLMRYLVVGLIDENIRVVHVVPEAAAKEATSPFVQNVTWRDSRFSLIRRMRLLSLADTLDNMGIDLLHAMHSPLWTGALSLGKRLELPVVLWATSLADVQLAARLRRKIATCRTAIATSTKPFATAIRQQVHSSTHVQTIPPGVHVANISIAEFDDQTSLCAIVSGNGKFDAEYETLFEAMRHIVNQHGAAQFFLDAQGGDQHTLWQAARRFGLLANINLVGPQVGSRDLLGGAHVLIHPQPLGKSLGITLQAMAEGVPVIARKDQWIDYLVADQTAWLIEQRNSDGWIEALGRLIRSPQEARELGQQAKRWVEQHHLAASHVEQLIKLYQQTTGESYKFESPDALSHHHVDR